MKPGILGQELPEVHKPPGGLVTRRSALFAVMTGNTAATRASDSSTPDIHRSIAEIARIERGRILDVGHHNRS